MAITWQIGIARLETSAYEIKFSRCQTVRLATTPVCK